MKNKLLLVLKPKLANKGFSQKTLEGLAGILAPNLTEESTDEEINTAIDGVMPYAELMQAENTRYANEIKGKQTKTVEEVATQAVATDEPADMPAWAKSLMESNKALAQGLEAIKGEKVVNTRKEQYAKTLEGTNEKYKAKALKDFDRISSTFKSDEEYNEWLTGETEVAKDFVQSDTFLGGDRPQGGANGAGTTKGKEASQSEVEEAFKNFKI